MKEFNKIRPWVYSILIGLIINIVPTAGYAAPALYAIDGNDPLLHAVNPISGAAISSIDISLPGQVIVNGTGLAVSPITGEMYAAVALESQNRPSRSIIKMDPATGIATLVGHTGQPVASLAFKANGVLYAVTGDCKNGCGGGVSPETLFTVNLNNGSLTFVQTLGNGDNGEAIGYNPVNGRMYHMSGIGAGLIFEKINLGNGNVTGVPLSGDPVGPYETIGFTFDAAQNLFVGSLIDCLCDSEDRSFYKMTPSGVLTHVNTLPFWWKDYAFYEAGGSGVLPGLVSIGDVNGDNNTDLGVLQRDSGTDRNKLDAFDGDNGNIITTVFFGSEQAKGFSVVDDANGDQVPEFGTLVKGSLFARIKDVVNGTLLGKPKFKASFEPIAFLSVGDAGGGAGPDVAVLGRKATTGKVKAQVRDVASGNLVSRFSFSTAFTPFYAAVVDNIANNAANEIAVLGINVLGEVQVQVKDALSGNLINKIQFNKKFTPLAFAAVPNAAGKLKFLAVLGRNQAGVIQAQIKRASDGRPIAAIKFSSGYKPKAFFSFADSNGSGGGEIGVVGVNGKGKVRAQVKEIADGTLVNLINFSTNYPPLDAIAINGVAGTGQNEIAVLGQHTNGEYRLQIKDLLTGDAVNVIVVP
jgi:hypothetical protein